MSLRKDLPGSISAIVFAEAAFCSAALSNEGVGARTLFAQAQPLAVDGSELPEDETGGEAVLLSAEAAIFLAEQQFTQAAAICRAWFALRDTLPKQLPGLEQVEREWITGTLAIAENASLALEHAGGKHR
jgi:hypothetical protein